MTERPRILALFGGVVLFGQERGNIEALAALKDQGCEVLCLISDAPWNTEVPRVLDERGLDWAKVPYVSFRIRGNLTNLMVHAPIAFVRANAAAIRINRRFRATHFHSMNLTFVLNFWLMLAFFRRTPLIYRAGDQPPRSGHWHALWRLAVSRVSRFVANSQFIKSSLEQDGVAAPVEIIYSRPSTKRHPAEHSGPVGLDEWFDFVFVGQMTEHKGPHLLIDAFAGLCEDFPAARLLLIGRISDWEGDLWARELRDRTLGDPKLRDRIVFAGFREDVPALLKRSGILVVPSIWDEPFPNVVIEAKEAGRPAIVFPRGGLPEMVSDGVDGFICRDTSPETLAAAMRRYLEQPELGADHGAAARRSLERFAVDRFAERWLSVYEATFVRQPAGVA